MLLADFHVHSTWSDGRLSIPEIVDLFGRSGHDVIAITDHVVNSDSLLGKIAHGCRLSITKDNFDAYRAEIEREARRAWDAYRMVVLAGLRAHAQRAHGKALGPRPRARPRALRLRRRPRRGDAHAGPRGRRRDRGLPSERAVGLVREHVLPLEPAQGSREARRPLGARLPLGPLPAGLPRAPPVRRQQRLPRPAAPLRLEDAHGAARRRPDAVLATLRAGQGPRRHAPSRTRPRRRRASPSETEPLRPCTVIPGFVEPATA